MAKEPPLRAQSDHRLLDAEPEQQGQLFDEVVGQTDDQLLADYRQRYGLAEDPFANDYSFPLFTAGGRRQLLDQLLHLCQFSNSLLLLVGEYDVGKTRIAHAFMDSLSEADKICFLTLKAGQKIEQTLLAVVQGLEIPFTVLPTAENLLSCLEDFIADDQALADEGLAVVVVDDAHYLDDKSIQLITSLLHSFPQQTRLHFVLVGEPQLLSRVEHLAPDNLLINDFTLPSFTLAETVDYLNFRMEMADYLGPEIFTESMVDPWWRQAQGEIKIIHELAQDRLLESVTPKRAEYRRPLPVLHIVAISMLIALVGVLYLYMDGDKKNHADSQLAAQPTTSKPLAVPTSAPQPSSRATALSDTATPVEPILPSLPALPSEHNLTQAEVASLIQPQSEQDIEPKPVPAVALDEAVVNDVVVEHSFAQDTGTAAQAPQVPAAKPAASASVAAAPKPKATATQQLTATQTTTFSGKSAQEKTILAWPAHEYTIQLLGVSSAKSAQDYVAQQTNRHELLIFKSKRQGKDWFVVISGHFANSAQARQAIAGLPAKQRDAGPWPRDLKTIQQEIRAVP